MKSLFFIVNKASAIILTNPYQTKNGLLADFDCEPWEEVIELCSEDMRTEDQRDQFNELWLQRVKK